MSLFKNRTAFKAARKVKELLSASASFASRGAWGGSARQQIASKNKEIVALRKELDRARGVEHSPVSQREHADILRCGLPKIRHCLVDEDARFTPEIPCQGESRPFGRRWRQEYLKKRRKGYPLTSLYGAILSSEDLRHWIERSVWSKRDDSDEHLDNPWPVHAGESSPETYGPGSRTIV